MKQFQRNILTALLLIAGLISGCKKEEGEGGTATIQGKVLIRHLDGTQTFDTSYYGSDEDVYIIYGEDQSAYDDDYKTSYDGSYRFRFLQKGTYKVFAYSTDTTGLASGLFIENRPKVAVIHTIEVEGRNQTIDVPDLVIIKYN